MAIKKSFFLLILILAGFKPVLAQDAPEYRKNAFSFNLTRYAVNELNLSFEHRYSLRRGIEFNAGLIYVNDQLQELTKDWVNTQYFYERGFAARIHYKIFKRKESDETSWRDYIAPGISYKYLYYNNQEFTGDNGGKTEIVYQHRFRNKISLEFLFGKVYEMNNTFALEFYYGAGITGTLSDRYVVYRIPDTKKMDQVLEVNDHSKTFYVRPMVMAGIKLRISL
jgi:hypothetical protein